MGQIDARAANCPSPARLQAWFPDAWNVDTWNLAALSPLVRSYTIGVGDFAVDQPEVRLWAQDDWQIMDRLTLNLGVRYDAGTDLFANDISFPPFQEAGRPRRLEQRAATARVCIPNDRTVIRGGSGLYYGDAFADADRRWQYADRHDSVRE